MGSNKAYQSYVRTRRSRKHALYPCTPPIVLKRGLVVELEIH